MKRNQLCIHQGDEIEDTNANIKESSKDLENEESITYLSDKNNNRNHVFQWRSSKPASGDYVFKGKNFTLPDTGYDETPSIYFKMFWNDELTEPIAEQTNT